MDNFQFFNPVKVVFGRGQCIALPKLIPPSAKVLIISGGGSIHKNGVFDQVTRALKDVPSVTWTEFSGVEPNPCFETLMKAAQVVREKKIDFILAVGGGSVLDGSKFVALASCLSDADFANEERAWAIVSKSEFPDRAIALGSVMTLPATGSEMNCFAVVTRKSTNEKLAFGNPKVFPKFSILDPEHTFSLPPRQVGNGIVDAYVHVMEQYLTKPANAHVQDSMSEAILKTLIEIGPKTLKEPTNYDYRASLVWAATQALNGLVGAGVPQDWTTHAVGHELTAFYGLDHGQTLAVILPSLMNVCREGKKAKILQYAERVWNIPSSKSENERVDEAIACTRRFFESVGVPTRLSAYRQDERHFKHIVSRMKDRGDLPLGENGDFDADKLTRTLRDCL